MIRYATLPTESGTPVVPLDVAELHRQLDVHAPATRRKKKWRDRAIAATQALQTDPAKEINGDLWSEVKKVYVDLQRGKCIYCERPLGRSERSLVAQDIEHYRPKNLVNPWVPPVVDPPARPLPAGVHSGPGYRLLAYHPLNYAVSCKACNTSLKANFFPLPAGSAPQWTANHPHDDHTPLNLNATEKPYLIFPFGGWGDPAEDLMTFAGYVAIAAQPAAPASQHEHDRGRVTVSFFKLNDEGEDLIHLRAGVIEKAGLLIETYEQATSASAKSRAKTRLFAMAADDKPFAGCVRALWRCYQSDPVRAKEWISLAEEYILTNSERWTG